MRVWRRSSRCDGGQCVEVAWGKSSASLVNSSCVEAGEGACGQVHLRDSKLGDRGPVLDFTATEWGFVLDSVRADEIPVGVATGPSCVAWYGLDGALKSVRLEFTYEEWDAFVAGVKAGEFDRFQVSIEDVAGALDAAGDRCVRCQAAPVAGTCCSSHGKKLCHRCYRQTHFVEVCVDGCSACTAESLPLKLT